MEAHSQHNDKQVHTLLQNLNTAMSIIERSTERSLTQHKDAVVGALQKDRQRFKEEVTAVVTQVIKTTVQDSAFRDQVGTIPYLLLHSAYSRLRSVGCTNPPFGIHEYQVHIIWVIIQGMSYGVE